MPIYLRITVDGQPTEISVGHDCEPSRWNKHQNRMSGNKEDAKTLNAYLDSLQLKITEIRRKALDSNLQITSLYIKEAIRGKTEKPKMLLELYQKEIDKVKNLIGKAFTHSTYVRYLTSMDHTKRFIQWKYNSDDIDIRSLDYEFINDFNYWFRSVRNCNHNTALKYISNFRRVINVALKMGYLHKDPFNGFKMGQKEVIRYILTKDEVDIIINKEFNTERLIQVRDAFIFSCFTGLAYADILKLKRSEISKGIDGDLWIFTSRQKTDIPSRIPLLPITLELIDKYKNHPACTVKNSVIPIPSNQKVNAYLKEIADLCGVNKNLTFHLARHTFATTVTLGNGVPIETVSKLLGHRNLRTTQHYAKILDFKVSEDFASLRVKL